MADSTTAILYGYHGLAARTVGVFACGLYLGTYTVSASGTITVTYGAAADVDGLFTLARVQSYHSTSAWGVIAKKVDAHVGMADLTYTIPALVGFRYTSRGKLLRPAAESEIKSSMGAGLAKPRNSHQIGMLVDGAIGPSFGVSFDELTAAVFTNAAGTALNHATMFSGVHQMPITPDRQKYDCEVCWEVANPYPFTLVSLTSFLHTEER